MARYSQPWLVVGVFVFGLIGGILVDRAVGGPGGLTVGIFVLLVPASLALAGPLAQEYWGQRFSAVQSNRARFRDHAQLLLNRVLWGAASASLSYDVLAWPIQGQGRYSVSARDGQGGGVPLRDLIQWSNARPHLLANETISPLLRELETRIDGGTQQKRELDDRFAREVSAVLKAELGFDLEPATADTGWSEWPPPALWFPGEIVLRLRTRRALSATDVEMKASGFSHSTGEPATRVQRLELNGQLGVQVVEPLTLDPAKFLVAYNQLLANADLKNLVAAALATADRDKLLVAEFGVAVSDYAEAVEASEKHLLGVCPACEHLMPR